MSVVLRACGEQRFGRHLPSGYQAVGVSGCFRFSCHPTCPKLHEAPTCPKPNMSHDPHHLTKSDHIPQRGARAHPSHPPLHHPRPPALRAATAVAAPRAKSPKGPSPCLYITVPMLATTPPVPCAARLGLAAGAQKLSQLRRIAPVRGISRGASKKGCRSGVVVRARGDRLLL